MACHPSAPAGLLRLSLLDCAHSAPVPQIRLRSDCLERILLCHEHVFDKVRDLPRSFTVLRFSPQQP